ncbi:MAG: hypothetical protein R3343_03800 [Nitriliruptorales bacterium]|nr:hypothetical protein [Nitriliruptorales bacterium]
MTDTPTWQQLADLARDLAATDVHREGAVRPTVYGYCGDHLIAGIELRPHPAGGNEAPLVEALALLVPAGADRLAFLGSGRAWSLEDPVPPVCDEGDLRQRVAVLLTADRHQRDRPTLSSTLMPFRCSGGQVDWSEPVHLDEHPEGPLPMILAAALTGPPDTASDGITLGRQALRLARLGHGLQLPEAGGDGRIAGYLLAALDSEAAGDPQPGWVLGPEHVSGHRDPSA